MSLQNLSKQELMAAIEAADALEKKRKYNKAGQYYTDTGKTARSLYPKHMEMFKAGKTHDIRGFVGGNGSGKSTNGAFETSKHLNGKYPDWWEGHKFKGPINAWVCARTGKALREGVQELLFGGISDEEIGTGMIAREDLLDDKGNIQKWNLSGEANCIGAILVRHYTDGVFDGYSKCEFHTYAQGWQEFQGPTRQWIMLDEEPDDAKIYAECLMRLRPKDGGDPGQLAAYFTPTQGYSNTYLAFVPGGRFPEDGEHIDNPKKYTVQVSSRNVPHLPKEYLESMIAELKLTDPGNIEARIDGIAAMGSGRVYPIDESFVVVPQFAIPKYWKKAYGLDPGASNTAVIWIAQNPDTGVMYIYDEYKNGRVLYLLHAEAIKTRGDWIGGAIDPHEAVKPRDTGETVQTYFETCGLHLNAAKGDPDALRARIRAMFESGALKILDSCQGLISEIRTYRYDMNDPNKIARNQDDHRCDALMYNICLFEQIANSFSDHEEEIYQERQGRRNKDTGIDDQRNQTTGY